MGRSGGRLILACELHDGGAERDLLPQGDETMPTATDTSKGAARSETKGGGCDAALRWPADGGVTALKNVSEAHEEIDVEMSGLIGELADYEDEHVTVRGVVTSSGGTKTIKVRSLAQPDHIAPIDWPDEYEYADDW